MKLTVAIALFDTAILTSIIPQLQRTSILHRIQLVRQSLNIAQKIHLRRIFLLRLHFKRSDVFIFHFPIFKHKDACLALSVSAVVPASEIERLSKLFVSDGEMLARLCHFTTARTRRPVWAYHLIVFFLAHKNLFLEYPLFKGGSRVFEARGILE